MANLANIRDSDGQLANRIALDYHATHLIVGNSGTIHGLLFDLPSSGAQISKVRKENDMREDYFHVSFLAFGFIFLLTRFILKVLNEYRIAPSQLAPNS